MSKSKPQSSHLNCAVQFRTAKYGAVQFRTIHHSTAQYSTVQYNRFINTDFGMGHSIV